MRQVIGGLLDSALDLTVAGGYSRLGYRLRRRWFEPLAPGALRGRTVLVTGATSGLGLATAAGCAELGADLWLLARDRARGEDVRAAVAERGEGRVTLELCDLAALSDVRRFARDFCQRIPRLDVLVNNAGVLTAERELSPDGIELTFAVNVLAGHLLLRELVPALQTSPSARVINVSSGGMYARRLAADDLQSERERFEGATAYARSKRAEVVLTELWARELAGSAVHVHAMHPGWADTPGVRDSLPGFYRVTRPVLRTPAEGADTIVWLAASAAGGESSGGFWHDRRRRPVHLLPGTRESHADRERLWAECERLTAGD